MKKYIFTLFLLLSTIFNGQSQVLIGNGTTTLGQFTPFKPYWRYSYAQSIYLGSEINASGTITSIQWYFTGTTAIPNSDNITVYLGLTNKTSFASTSDWVPVANMTKVFEGKITMDSPIGPGWKTITLTTPFVYDISKNLVIATDENDPGNENEAGAPNLGLEENFYNFAVIDNRSIYAVNGTTNIDPATPPIANNLKAFVPNIIIGGITPSCETPQNLTVNNITQTSATVRWENMAGTTPANGSEYYVTTSSVIPNQNTTPTGSITTGVTADLITLLPGTTYYVYVRNSCTSEKSPWSPSALFTTLCSNSVANFYENFDNLNTRPNQLTNCWSKIIRANSGTICPSARINSYAGGNAYTAPNYIEMSNCNSTGNYDIILVTPQLSNLNNNPNRLIFYSKGGIVEVGTLDKNTNDAVFTVYKTYNTFSADAYTKYEIAFKNYIGTDKYIGIKIKTNNEEQSYIYIDDVSWSFNPSCPDVSEVKVVSVTDATATIGWSEGANATSWDITYGAPYVTDPLTLPYFNTEDSGTYVITNLQPGTQYKAWVRSVCPGDNKGAYIGPVLFTTNCPTKTTFQEYFNSTPIGELPSCWGKILRANSGTLLPLANVVTANYDVYNETKCVNLSSGNSEGNFDVILVSPKVSTLKAGSNYRLRFRSRFSNKSIEIGTLNSSTNNATFTLFKTVQFNETGAKEEYIVDFSSYNGTNEYIAFRMPNIPGQGFAAIALDNIIWEPVPTCPEITNVAVINTTETSATVDWVSTPTESSWDVSYGPITATDPDADNLPVLNTYDFPYTIPELAIGTSYNVWVRANCEGEGKGTGEWIGPVAFATECEGIGPFIEKFDDPLTTTLPNLTTCWSKIMRGPLLSQYAYVKTTLLINQDDYSSPKMSMPNCVTISAQGSSKQADLILVSPKLNNLRGRNRLKFDTHKPGRIQVGTLDKNTNNATFTVIKEILLKSNVVNNKAVGDSPVIEITNYSGSDTHLGIRLMPNPNAFAEPDPKHPEDFIPGFPEIDIDNIVWEPIPGCIEVSNVQVTSVTTTTATTTWIKGQNETKWEIAYSSTITNPDLINPLVTVNSSPTTTLTNLTPGTTYNLWVRAVCDNSNSAWVGPVLFTTECLSTNVPYYQDFNSAIVPNLPNCTTETKVGFGNNWQTADPRPGNDYTYDTKKLQYQGDFSETANAWFFTQGINLTQGTEYTISYKYGSDSNAAIRFNNLKVMYGTSNTPNGMTLLLAKNDSYYGFDNKAKVNFVAPTSGIYYFGFNAYSESGQGFMFLDNIVIDEFKLSNNEFDINQFSYYPNPVKDALNISYVKDISSVTVYNLLGQKVLTNILKANTSRIDMSTLSKGTYLVKIVSDNQTKTIKIIKE